MLFPEPGEISLEIAYSSEHRVRQGDRPWIVMSMISTVDGAISLEGNSALLGGPADRAVFLHLHRAIQWKAIQIFFLVMTLDLIRT